MASYGSLCRSRSVALLRFSRPAIRGDLFPRQGFRNLSSLNPHRVGETSKKEVSSPRTTTQQQQQQQANLKEELTNAQQPEESLPPSTSSVMRLSPKSLTFTGGAVMPVTTELKIVTPQEDAPRGVWPVYRLLDEDGEFRDPLHDNIEKSCPFSPAFSQEKAAEEDQMESFVDFLCESHPRLASEFRNNRLLSLSNTPYNDISSRHTLLRAHRQIVRLRQMDTILLNAQRQGRISFYMTCTGEEGIHVGAASALDPQDPILAQYREQGLLMWRGFTLEQFTMQCFSTDLDLGRGRQMPVHYGSKALQYHTVSSPLGTQLPQAVGVAYRLKLAKKPNVAVCFFGDGCASTTDFHSALNFAATLKAPVVFFCRNNGYAISTPVTDQYAGDGIVSRAPGYGMAAIRVDGGDMFAVHAAVREARAYALKHQAPVLIEAMSYRLGHHSTSDDSIRYRSAAEVEDFGNHMDPLDRVQKFMIKHGLLTAEEAERIREDERFAVVKAMEKAEKRPKPPMDQLFEDVYHDLPASLELQKKSLEEHVAKYPKKYAP